MRIKVLDPMNTRRLEQAPEESVSSPIKGAYSEVTVESRSERKTQSKRPIPNGSGVRIQWRTSCDTERRPSSCSR